MWDLRPSQEGPDEEKGLGIGLNLDLGSLKLTEGRLFLGLFYI